MQNWPLWNYVASTLLQHSAENPFHRYWFLRRLTKAIIQKDENFCKIASCAAMNLLWGFGRGSHHALPHLTHTNNRLGNSKNFWPAKKSVCLSISARIWVGFWALSLSLKLLRRSFCRSGTPGFWNTANFTGLCAFYGCLVPGARSGVPHALNECWWSSQWGWDMPAPKKRNVQSKSAADKSRSVRQEKKGISSQGSRIFAALIMPFVRYNL